MTGRDAGQLERELKDAFKNRALIYWEIYDELRRELGPEKAGALLARAIERRGKAAGDALFRGMPADPVKIGERFLAVSPANGRLFPTDVRRDDKGGIHIQVTVCPLKEAWEEAKLPAADMATICKIAGHFDNGVFVGRGVKFSAETWTEGKSGCCCLHLERS
ncbi:MAG: hypothetical protein FJX60_07075 [Alphaproteobacteria bacterium]|nr:hypothetical protein [Alphaproteobacteria bacterium]